MADNNKYLNNLNKNQSKNNSMDHNLNQIPFSRSSTISEDEQTLIEVIPVERKKVHSRLYWADCARIISMVSIVLLHSAGNGCEKTLLKKNDKDWIIICIYNCMVRFGVPMFTLLSGTFILDPSKKFTFKKLFGHNILRLATAFVFWSTVNALLNIYLYRNNKPAEFFKLFFVGEEYLWYIFMIIGCYLISPFLRFFSDNIILARYFLGLCIIWGSFIPTLKNIFHIYNFKEAENALDEWLSHWHYHFTLEFVGYYVAGYHIVKHVNIKSVILRIFIYILGLVDLIVFITLTYGIEAKDNTVYSKEFRDNYSLTVVIYSIILFLFFKHEIGRIKFSEKAIKIITKLSSLTFGMYLSHMIIKFLLSHYAHISQIEFFGLSVRAAIGCPIFAIIITILSILTSYLLSKIPVLNKYIL